MLFVNYRDLEDFINTFVIPNIKLNQIKLAVPEISFTQIIMSGTVRLERTYNKYTKDKLIVGPNIRHNGNEEDRDYWHYLFPPEYWMNLAEIAERELDWPADFSISWSNYMCIWVYALINPSISQAYINYYSKDMNQEGTTSVVDEKVVKHDVDPYVADYEQDVRN